MKKTLFTVVVALVAPFAAGSLTSAQSSEEALIKVPFQFIAGEKLMPAGSYLVSGQTGDWTMVKVASVDGKSVATVRSKVVARGPLPGIQPRFWFTNYFGQYFLQRLWLPGLDVREVRLTQADAERTLARLNLLGPDHPASVR